MWHTHHTGCIRSALATTTHVAPWGFTIRKRSTASAGTRPAKISSVFIVVNFDEWRPMK
ncbi:MAG: hypothetical protein ACI30I_03810 [Parabacteroides sp.]